MVTADGLGTSPRQADRQSDRQTEGTEPRWIWQMDGWMGVETQWKSMENRWGDGLLAQRHWAVAKIDGIR